MAQDNSSILSLEFKSVTEGFHQFLDGKGLSWLSSSILADVVDLQPQFLHSFRSLQLRFFFHSSILVAADIQSIV